MREITPELTPDLLKHFGDKNKVAVGSAFRVKSFKELVLHTAKLSYLNKDNLLFYRGQTHDYKTKTGKSTFYPSIYRGEYVQKREIENNFEILDSACRTLTKLFEEENVDGVDDVKKRKSIQWSILQHYEVCSTPLLDFTQSLRVACSFALTDNDEKEAFVFVFGLPFLTNRISRNSEHDIINVRLLSICPPPALRPYFQEGYVVGTDDVTTNYKSKDELDFNNRLIAKFLIPNTKSFWGDGFHMIPKNSLYPPDDPIESLCRRIRDIAETELRPGTLGEFLKAWTELEEKLLNIARHDTFRIVSVREAIRILVDKRIINENQFYMFDRLRKFRNIVVHNPKEIRTQEVMKFLELAKELNGTLSI